jgi:hypothetical protein
MKISALSTKRQILGENISKKNIGRRHNPRSYARRSMFEKGIIF